MSDSRRPSSRPTTATGRRTGPHRHEPTGAPEAHEYFHTLQLERLPALLDTARAGELLGVSRQTVYRLVECGELAGVRTGRQALRIFRDSVRDFLKRRLV